MSYLQLDDGILDHPKFVRAERLAPSWAVHLWLGLMSYCKRHLTDGIVPIDMLGEVNGPPTRYRSRALDALVTAELIERSESELRVHDYLEWNLSKAEIERKSADRKSAAERRRLDHVRAPTVGPVATHSRPAVVAETEQRRPAVVAETTQRHRVSNDVIALSAPVSSHCPARARKTETETETETEIRSPSIPPKLALEPPTQIASTSSARTRKSSKPRGRTKCPADFKPDETTQAYATSLGFQPDVELKTRREFINWWMGDGGLKANWQATYRNRLDVRAEALGLKPPPADTPQRRLWLEQRAKAEAPPAKVAPHAREALDAAKAELGRALFAS